MSYEDPMAVIEELGLKESDWDIRVDFTKGFQGNRGVVVTITHRPTNVKKKVSVRSTTKRDSRAKAVELTRRILSGWP